MFNKSELESIINLLRHASHTAIQLQQNNLFSIKTKEDGTLVTDADIQINDILTNGIKEIFGERTNIVSEEAVGSDAQSEVFVIDPIDGTNSFIKGKDFCINIAYFEQKQPVFGIIAIPKSDSVYYSWEGKVYKIQADVITELHKKESSNDKIILSGHRSVHGCSIAFKKILSNLSEHNINIGECQIATAAIKYCMLMDGKGDMVINIGALMDWDIAAPYCMLKNLGYHVTDAKGKPLVFFQNTPHNGLFASEDSEVAKILL